MQLSHNLYFASAEITALQLEHKHSFGVNTIVPSLSSIFISQFVPIFSSLLNSAGRTILPSSSIFLTIISSSPLFILYQRSFDYVMAYKFIFIELSCHLLTLSNKNEADCFFRHILAAFLSVCDNFYRVAHIIAR